MSYVVDSCQEDRVPETTLVSIVLCLWIRLPCIIHVKMVVTSHVVIRKINYVHVHVAFVQGIQKFT